MGCLRENLACLVKDPSRTVPENTAGPSTARRAAEVNAARDTRGEEDLSGVILNLAWSLAPIDAGRNE